MHMGVIDTTPRIQYRKNPYTGDPEFRYVWEDDNLGGWFSSAWKSIKNVGSKVVSVVKKGVKIVAPIVAIGVGVVNPAAGAALGQAIKSYDSYSQQKAAKAIAASAGAPVEIPTREQVVDKARYDQLMRNLEIDNAAGKVANVRYIAKQLNALALLPPGGVTGGMTLPQPTQPPYQPATPPYVGSNVPTGSIEQPFIPGASPTQLPAGYTIGSDGKIYKVVNGAGLPPGPAQAGFGNIPLPWLLGGGALLLIMVMKD